MGADNALFQLNQLQLQRQGMWRPENFSADVLSELAPPQCYTGSDAKTHWWKMKFRAKDDAWAARAESFSGAFNRPWLDALQKVQKAWNRSQV